MIIRKFLLQFSPSLMTYITLSNRVGDDGGVSLRVISKKRDILQRRVGDTLLLF